MNTTTCNTLRSALAATVSVTLVGCGAMMSREIAAPNVASVVAVPAGHKVVSVLKGEGLLTYECRANASGAPAAFGWTPPAPDAVLKGTNGAVVGKYYPGPTWEHNDGSKVTGKQLAVSPVSTGIAQQLVQANPATGNGMFNGVTYIQRVNTVGGLPVGNCTEANLGAKQAVKYEADYYFYKAG